MTEETDHEKEWFSPVTEEEVIEHVEAKLRRKSPEEAVRYNIESAISQLETAGSRLFKAKKADLLPEVQKISKALEDLRGKVC